MAHDVPYCSFCGRGSEQVGKMADAKGAKASNPRIYICLECANLAVDSLGGDRNSGWPLAIATRDRLHEESELVIAWKRNINGWDVVVGRRVIESPQHFTYWLPIIPPPE